MPVNTSPISTSSISINSIPRKLEPIVEEKEFIQFQSINEYVNDIRGDFKYILEIINELFFLPVVNAIYECLNEVKDHVEDENEDDEEKYFKEIEIYLISAINSYFKSISLSKH